MRITTTDRYLSLVQNALENTLIPELSSSDAKATAEIINKVLVELRQREHSAPQQLNAHITRGRQIAARMGAAVTELGGAQPPLDLPTSVSGSESTVDSFRALSDTQAKLTETITQLANALVAGRGETPIAASAPDIPGLLREAADWERDYYISRSRSASAVSQKPAVRTRGAPLTRESLQAFLRTQHPDRERCSVSSFEPVPGGYSRQTFRFSLVDSNGKHQALIVRKDGLIQSMAYGGFLIDREYHLLKDVHASGLPVAEPLYLGVDVIGIDADFYVMTALPGKLPGSFLGGATETIPEALLLHMAELLARLHGLKPDSFYAYTTRYQHGEARIDTVASCYRHQIAEAKAYYRRAEFLPSPYMVYLFDWLEHNIPESSESPVLVHGDFNIHNVLAEDDRVSGILDWECANFGTPEQDFAWIKPHISEHIDWDLFVGRYRACGGTNLDADTMNFCTAFNAMRTSLAANKLVLNLQQGLDPSIRFAMIELGFVLAHMKPASD